MIPDPGIEENRLKTEMNTGERPGDTSYILNVLLHPLYFAADAGYGDNALGATNHESLGEGIHSGGDIPLCASLLVDSSMAASTSCRVTVTV